MIAIEEFIGRIQSTLNNNPYGFHYVIHSDSGTFKKAFKDRTEKVLYTNALLRIGASSIVPTQSVVVATQSAVIELVVQLFNPNTDSEVITAHRNVLTKYTQKPVIDSMDEKDESGKVIATYTVTALYSLVNTGDIAERDDAGTSITFYINVDFTYIQNGLNSSNCKFTLDGMLIPYGAAKITKTPTAQGDAFSDNNGQGVGMSVSYNRSFDFQMPALKDNALGALVLDELLGNTMNTPHTLVVTLGNKTDTYNVIFGAVDMSVTGIDNAGHNISLIEARVI